jgi:hypothetical protein
LFFNFFIHILWLIYVPLLVFFLVEKIISFLSSSTPLRFFFLFCFFYFLLTKAAFLKLKYFTISLL